MRKPAALSIALSLLGMMMAPPTTRAAAPAVCPFGYTVGFFNGVGNTEVMALNSAHALQKAIQESQNTTADVYGVEDVSYHVYYNHTGSSVGSNTAQDVAETFIQRAKDIDPSGGIGQNYLYLFWEWLDASPQAYSPKITDPVLNSFFSKFVNAAVTVAVKRLADIYSTPPTTEDYAQQQADLTVAANAGRKLLLVAHSQGNLFVNQGYDFIQAVVGSQRVKVVHVAPASPTLRGQYVLSDHDIVINALRLVNGFTSVVANNITLAYSTVDPSGHGFSETYLDGEPGRDGRTTMKQLFVAGLAAMDTQQCELGVTPASSKVKPGDQVALTAQLTPPLPADSLAVVTYKWSIAGNMGGYFVNPVTGGTVASLVTATPAVTYNVPPGTANPSSDTVSVEEDVSNLNDSSATSKTLASAQATIALGSSTTVNIVLTQPWTDTGLALIAGQQVTIKTSGTMDYWTGGCPSTQNCIVTADGLPWSTCSGSTAGPYLAPGLACFSLVGKIGANGAPFEVGSMDSFTVPSAISGELYLGVNDNNYPDNTGSWTSTIN